ncbi:MAG: hypothetical protein IK081_14995 [Lachnospiraceae bacterium]|nr:hypothetical protein [Lachnospiraceae bacterium]
MKKSTVCTIAVICMLILIGLCAYVIHVESEKENKIISERITTVSVSQGTPDKEKSTLNLTVEKSGEYRAHFSWAPEGIKEKDFASYPASDLGFVTVLVLFNDKDEEIFATSGTVLNTAPVVELSAGTYRAEYIYVTTPEQYEKLAVDYLCGAYQAPLLAKELAPTFASLKADGTWNVQHEFRLVPSASYHSGQFYGVIFGLLIGICISVLMLAAMSTSKKIMESPKYDERQELERGRGFKLTFYVMLIFTGITFAFDMGGFFPEMDYSVLYVIGLFLSISVHVNYCIWHEAYFALNQKMSSVMTIFGFITLCNLVLVIFSVMDGSLYQNGHFSYSVLNLFCTLTFLSMFVTMLFKKRDVAKKNALIAEEDEEDE